MKSLVTQEKFKMKNASKNNKFLHLIVNTAAVRKNTQGSIILCLNLMLILEFYVTDTLLLKLDLL